MRPTCFDAPLSDVAQPPRQAPRLAPCRLRAAVALGLSALLHLAVLLVLMDIDVRAGDPRALPMVLLADLAPRSTANERQRTPSHRAPIRQPASAWPDETPPKVEPSVAAQLADLVPRIETTLASAAALDEILRPPTLAFVDEGSSSAPSVPRLDAFPLSVVDIAPAEQSALIDRLIQAAATIDEATHTVVWQQQGREFRALLRREGATDSTMLERITAQVTTTDQGTSLQTELLFSRLAFSQFTQLIDRWDPNVQLHDDEIVGRFHSNSSFFVARSHEATPKFLGKVTTAARGFRFGHGARRSQQQIFQGGLQTSAERIEFPAHPAAFGPPSHDPQAYVHRFTQDTHLVFEGDGSYSFRGRREDHPQRRTYAPDRPAFLIASAGVSLYVRGTLRGRVLVYSPKRIVIEGSLRYATDPRLDAAADDYLGLVSDRNVEIARPYVTGRGDLHIDAAIFARRRFLVTDIEHPRRATLSIYGSLTAGTLSATEPRYGTRIEFDPRLDHVRPPGFPSTDRYELANWDGQWHRIAPERHAAGHESMVDPRH